MNTVQRTLGIIALVILTAQTVRHAYLLWLEPRGSVLDRYDQPLKNEIAAAKSLDELVAMYEPVRKEADRAKSQAPPKKGEDAYLFDRIDQEPFKSEASLRNAIHDWEAKARELHSLRFYWLVGLCLLLGGTAIFHWANQWLGLPLEIAAFSEFIYWTSPTFFGGVGREFDRLLASKLFFSLLSLALLLAVAWVQRVFANTKAEQHLDPAG